MRYSALRPAARTVAGVGLILLIPFLAGCAPAIGKVTGKVTYKGQPVPGGFVTFRPVDGRQNAVTATLEQDGRYSTVEIPAGEVMVTIDNRELEPRSSIPSLPPNVPLSPEMRAKLGSGKAAAPPPPGDGAPATGEDVRRPSGRYLPIPEKYYNAESSGLKFTIKGGEQTLDIELTD
jgi:hypothetical protein